MYIIGLHKSVCDKANGLRRLYTYHDYNSVVVISVVTCPIHYRAASHSLVRWIQWLLPLSCHFTCLLSSGLVWSLLCRILAVFVLPLGAGWTNQFLYRSSVRQDCTVGRSIVFDGSLLRAFRGCWRGSANGGRAARLGFGGV